MEIEPINFEKQHMCSKVKEQQCYLLEWKFHEQIEKILLKENLQIENVDHFQV
jgi:hypothetical protein